MVPGCKSSLPSIGTCGIQLGLGAALVSVGLFTEESWLFYSYYGVGILVVPLLIRLASGHALVPYQRLYFSLGLALHPYSMYFVIYPDVWWWDVLAHFVSGSLLAAGLYIVVRGTRGLVGEDTTATLAVHALVFAGMVSGAVAWEVYEVFAPWLTVYGAFDTAKDVVVAVVAWAVVAGIHERVLEEIPRGAAARVGTLAPLVEAPEPTATGEPSAPRLAADPSRPASAEDGSPRAVTDGGPAGD